MSPDLARSRAPPSPSRRELLWAAGGLAAVAASPAGPPLGPTRPFRYLDLRARARDLARRPYVPLAIDPALTRVDFDAFEALVYDPSKALFGGPGEAEVRLFPQGRLFAAPVRIFILKGGLAREVLYSPDLFHAPKDHPIRQVRQAGFGGFRVMNPTGGGDWLAFLGASYFRAAGPFNQYGASARGVAVNAGGPAREEFPVFTSFWLEPLPDQGLRAYALLEGESLAGAFVFDNRRSPRGVEQTITADLFLRRPVETLGLAPLTSMFWYGEDAPPARRDWRPSIHDSDGLWIATGRGEEIFRPLQNPPHVITNAFQDDHPKAFGLLQRDRAFDHYQDDGLFYDRRPDAVVLPETGFGSGSVRLVELPTVRETDDNIVAFFTPRASPPVGPALRLAYGLAWTATAPVFSPLAKVEATRTGQGGVPGAPPRPGWRRVVVDFSGDILKGRDRLRGVLGEVSSPSGGKIENVSAYGVVGEPTVWRLIFDVELQTGRPTDLRARLTAAGQILSETWIYQLFSPV